MQQINFAVHVISSFDDRNGRKLQLIRGWSSVQSSVRGNWWDLHAPKAIQRAFILSYHIICILNNYIIIIFLAVFISLNTFCNLMFVEKLH